MIGREEEADTRRAVQSKVIKEREDVTTCAFPGSVGSEGYGEITMNCISKVFMVLQQLTECSALRGTIDATDSAWNLTENSSFCDIGSGYGKVVFHSKVTSCPIRARAQLLLHSNIDMTQHPLIKLLLKVGLNVARSVGIECVQSRWQIALEALEDFRRILIYM